MTTTVVKTTAELTTALKAAQAGDTVLLATGTYADVTVRNLNLDGVTVASETPTAPAVITGLAVSSSSGLTFRDIEVRVPGSNVSANTVTLTGVHDVHLIGLDVHGSLDGDPQNDGRGILVRDSDDVSIEDSEFHELYAGVSHNDNTHLTVRGNSFHDIRVDGVRGGGTSWLTITDNVFRDFKPLDDDHADGVQLWTTNITTTAHDIVISNNQLMRGAGADFQGIQVYDEDHVGYARVTISGNLVSGNSYNGIVVRAGDDVTITDNIVQGYTDKASFIVVGAVDGLVVTGNQANKLKIDAGATHVTSTDNALISQASDGGVWAYQAWQAAHAAPTGLNLTGDASANTLTGGALADTLAGGAGSDVLAGGAGDDLYISDGKPTITELAAGGVDTLRNTQNTSLAVNVENLELIGTKSVWGYGNDGANAITGNSGANNLRGKAGGDTLSGGAGGDTLNGGTGDDLLTGGAGADTFVFARREGVDTVTDFGAGAEHDVLDLSALYGAGLTATVIDTAAGVILSFAGGQSIALLGVDPAQLHATASGYIF